ncbi:MAG: hypothetical protein GKR93_06250 [Gammaproteobacteria bacterium]|nr:hypothetical protein [Gammaproteobacteria bacterium]
MASLKRRHIEKDFVLILLCLGLTACGKKDNSYFPLSSGYEWHYQVLALTTDGVHEQRIILHSLDPREIDGQSYFVLRSLTGLLYLYRSTEDGLEQEGYLRHKKQEDEFVSDRVMLLPKQLEVGYEWESMMKTRTLGHKWNSSEARVPQMIASVPVNNRIENTNAVVTTAAGRFNNCLEISTKGFSFHKGGRFSERTLVEIDQLNWYAPGVGLVKSVIKETSSNQAFAKGEWRLELESYRPPKTIFDFS